MSNKEEMNYRIHLPSGAIWLCHDFGYAKDVWSDTGLKWIDYDVFVMVEAVPEQYLRADRQPTPFVPLLHGVEAVEILPEPRIPHWHILQRGKAENFA